MVNAQDRKVFDELIRRCDRGLISVEPPDQLVVGIGKFFLGTPYLTGPLETNPVEKLTVNLRGYDCVTFVENVVALTQLTRSGQNSFNSFRKKMLEHLRDYFNQQMDQHNIRQVDSDLLAASVFSFIWQQSMAQKIFEDNLLSDDLKSFEEYADVLMNGIRDSECG